jgi:Zn-dependent protease
MSFADSEWLRSTLISAPALLMSLTVHEVAHARTALAFGDPTAHYQGRTSFNPLRHLDPIGTIALFLVGFGWAKPVPINPNNFHPPRLGNFAVSLAGPMSNLGLAFVFGLMLRAVWQFRLGEGTDAYDLLLSALRVAVIVNICLFTFNLVPLFPLDGNHILGELLPPRMHWNYVNWQIRNGRTVLYILIFLPRLLDMGGSAHFSPIGAVQSYGYEMLKSLLGLPF